MSRETKSSGANADRAKTIYPVQPTTSRIGNHTQMIPFCSKAITIRTRGQSLFSRQVPKTSVGAERRIEVKFKDDADDNGRTPARPLPARYVVPLPDGYEETDEGKSGGPDGAGTAVGGGGIAGTGMAGGGREVDHDAPEDAIGEFCFCISCQTGVAFQYLGFVAACFLIFLSFST